MGQFIGTHKPDGYNTEEELDEMALFRAVSQKEDCECCSGHADRKKVQTRKDDLDRMKLRLRVKGQYKLGEEAAKTPVLSTADIFHDDEFDSKIRYTSSRGFTDLDKIYAAYPHNEFLVFMADGALVLMDTSGGGFCWDLILTEEDVVDEWLHEALDDQHPWVRVWDIYIPGATKIFTKEI